MAARIVFLVFVGLPLVFFLSRTIRQYASKKYSQQQGMVAGKLITYTGLFIIAFSLLNEMGFKLTHLLAAAGVVGIAIGFASQTSIANIISGLFLIAEESFVVGDVISVGGTQGKVLSVDILSVKIVTFDNRLVRIPNENIIKSELTNNTRFPVRRVDLNISVAYKENISKVREILFKVAHDNPLCLQNPEPVFLFREFGDSSINLLFAAWTLKSDFAELKNQLQEQVKVRFEEEGIEIPFPHVSIYKGAVSEPFPVELVENATPAKPGA
jgi:small-conductance mechanosensitive channel